jgi:hypothetical protein
MTWNLVGAAWLLLSFLNGPLDVTEVPNFTRAHGVFALADADGTRLIALADLPRPGELKTALCVGGERFPARFERRQEEKENNGRQSADNFDKLPGYIFSLPGKAPGPLGTCFLGSDPFLASAKVLPLTQTTGPGRCTPSHRRQFAKLRGREVAHCWPMGDVSPEKGLVLIQFAHRGQSALASLVLVDRERTLFADFPAEYRGKGEDVWRVSDGGKLSPEGMQVVFLIQQNDSSYALGISWLAEEGESVSLFVSGPRDSFTQVIQDAWYQAPV